MGKRINITPFPRCLHGISCAHPSADDGGGHRSRRSAPRVKVIRSDGVVKIYDRPIRACQLMEEFPKHMACRSDCFYIGLKTPALAADDLLLPGDTYFLLPANFFQSALSFASFLQCGRRRPAFEVEKTASGSLRIKVTEEMIFRMQEEEEMAAAAAERMVRICTTPQLKKDYEMLVGRRYQWKPKLDTISEKKSQQKKKNRKKKGAV